MGSEIRGVRSERLPSDSDFSSEWRMLRTPTNGRTLKLIVHSADMLGMRTHHWQRRTGPCYDVNCEPCARGQASRWYGYVLGQLESGERVIFEFPPPAGKQLDEIFQKYGTMRGVCVIASRTCEKFNAKVHLQDKGIWSQAHTIKLVPETWPVLARIWGVHTMPNGTVGPMQAQEVSEYEEKMGGASPVPVRSRNRIPQKSLLKNAPAQACEASASELLETIAQSAFLDGAAIARVNGRSHAKK